MHVQTHLLSGWCAADLLPCTPRQRLAAMVAAVAPDADGISILFGQEAYWRFHHTFGHNVFFAIAVGVALAVWARPFWGTVALCFAMVHLHLYLDHWGSGPGWHIHYLWPIHAWTWRNPLAWELFSWQNLTAFAALLAWTAWIARHRRRTPLELLMPGLDRQLVEIAVNIGRDRRAIFAVHAGGGAAVEPVLHTGESMANTSVTKVSSESAPKGAMGQKYLASGISVAMRMWDAEQPGEPKPAEAREYETVGYVLKGRAELQIEGDTITLTAGDSWVVNKGQRHTYRILEAFTAVEATTPPARVHGRDE